MKGERRKAEVGTRKEEKKKVNSEQSSVGKGKTEWQETLDARRLTLQGLGELSSEFLSAELLHRSLQRTCDAIIRAEKGLVEMRRKQENQMKELARILAGK